MRFCGEIQYDRGYDDTGSRVTSYWIHSDICFNCNPSNDSRALTDTYRQFLHEVLDEWLNKSNGTGAFWIGDPEYFKTWES